MVLRQSDGYREGLPRGIGTGYSKMKLLYAKYFILVVSEASGLHNKKRAQSSKTLALTL